MLAVLDCLELFFFLTYLYLIPLPLLLRFPSTLSFKSRPHEAGVGRRPFLALSARSTARSVPQSLTMYAKRDVGRQHGEHDLLRPCHEQISALPLQRAVTVVSFTVSAHSTTSPLALFLPRLSSTLLRDPLTVPFYLACTPLLFCAGSIIYFSLVLRPCLRPSPLAYALVPVWRSSSRTRTGAPNVSGRGCFRCGPTPFFLAAISTRFRARLREEARDRISPF